MGSEIKNKKAAASSYATAN